MNVDSLILVLVGGAITLLGTLWAHSLRARQEDLKRQETLNGVLQGIHDEIQALWTTYKEGMGHELEALEDNTPFFGYYPLTQEYCTIYTGNSSLIGQIRDHNLRKAIVTTYLMFKVVLDSYKVHNEIQREHSSWHMMQGQTNNVVHKEYEKIYYQLLIQHTVTLKRRHYEWKEKVEELLEMLRCASESFVIPISRAKRIKRSLKKIGNIGVVPRS